jgi:hypothetical protein
LSPLLFIGTSVSSVSISNGTARLNDPRCVFRPFGCFCSLFLFLFERTLVSSGRGQVRLVIALFSGAMAKALKAVAAHLRVSIGSTGYSSVLYGWLYRTLLLVSLFSHRDLAGRCGLVLPFYRFFLHTNLNCPFCGRMISFSLKFSYGIFQVVSVSSRFLVKRYSKWTSSFIYCSSLFRVASFRANTAFGRAVRFGISLLG